jgi:hypothetical protein
MSPDEAKTGTGANGTTADSSLTMPSATSRLEEKQISEIGHAVDNDATEVMKSDYPQGWKLWLVYIATLLTMFLVSFLSSENLYHNAEQCLNQVPLDMVRHISIHRVSCHLLETDLLICRVRPSSQLRSPKSLRNSRVSMKLAGMVRPSF